MPTWNDSYKMNYMGNKLKRKKGKCFLITPKYNWTKQCLIESVAVCILEQLNEDPSCNRYLDFSFLPFDITDKVRENV